MKKFFLLTVILATMPVFASCPIDGSGSACTIAEFQTPKMQPYSKKSDVQEFSEEQPTDLEPTSMTTERSLRTFMQKGSDFNYNASCQFGICKQTGTPQSFPERTDTAGLHQ